ncbi:MAG: hypothetical protein LH702_37455 [Phormidesmis sp. CAN_BIN44]|nr:hypothetical protein [Phormidesmis sp. CAN_BIN44]
MRAIHTSIQQPLKKKSYQINRRTGQMVNSPDAVETFRWNVSSIVPSPIVCRVQESKWYQRSFPYNSKKKADSS